MPIVIQTAADIDEPVGKTRYRFRRDNTTSGALFSTTPSQQGSASTIATWESFVEVVSCTRATSKRRMKRKTRRVFASIGAWNLSFIVYVVDSSGPLDVIGCNPSASLLSTTFCYSTALLHWQQLEVLAFVPLWIRALNNNGSEKRDTDCTCIDVALNSNNNLRLEDDACRHLDMNWVGEQQKMF